MLEAVREIWFGEGTTYIKICYGNVYVDGEAGQIGDRGKVDGLDILSVSESNNEILIKVDGIIDKDRGESVEIKIDETRRRDISQQHTAQHLLSAVFLRELDAETVGFQMGEEHTTIDLSLGILKDDMIDNVERTCNELISDNLQVRRFIAKKPELERLDLRKEVKREIAESGREITLVEIDGVDLNACSGLHVESTGRIRLLKILKREKVKGELTRIYFVAGDRAVRDYIAKHDLITESALSLTCSYSDLPNRVESLLYEAKKGNSAVKNLSERLAIYIAKEIDESKSKVTFLEDEESVLAAVPRFVALERYLIVGKARDKILLYGKGTDCKEVLNRVKEEFDVKGGSGRERGQFVFEGDYSVIKELILKSFG
ncbi:MAG TPA: alanyl-tRNA editing protein [Mesotoga infera]|uniref:Alanyl-tRNA editing protein n=1 Tax=Mesotoga infera TaxID=1236046 RepID=A0A7C1H5V0_9BACT|nr:alanyl-tRNA editing protein [Mesotoga infera]